MPPAPLISFVLATHNRRDVLLHTLKQLHQTGLPPDRFEVFVIDDASTDGTGAAVARGFPSVRLIRTGEPSGPVSKNLALPHVRAPYVMFLDDDSYPSPDSLPRMIEHFERDPRLAAAVFTVTLPDGSQECSAYPDVFIGCGTAFRRAALQQVGGLPAEFFMQAEEYDLSLRLLDAGWSVRRFDDLHVAHLKTPLSRSSARTTALDVRNNLTLIAKHFPSQWVRPYSTDWLLRYYLLAKNAQRRLPFFSGARAGLTRALYAQRRPISDEAFERFAKVNETRRRLAVLKRRHDLRRILFADLGKNVTAYRLAARDLDLAIVAIADPRLAPLNTTFRGVPLVSDEHALALDFDAVVVANLSPVHAALRTRHWQRLASRPVFHLFPTLTPAAPSSPLPQAA